MAQPSDLPKGPEETRNQNVDQLLSEAEAAINQLNLSPSDGGEIAPKAKEAAGTIPETVPAPSPDPTVEAPERTPVSGVNLEYLDSLISETDALFRGEEPIAETDAEGADFIARFKASFARRPEDQIKILKNVLKAQDPSKDYEVTVAQGRLFFREQGKGKFRPFDPESVTGVFNSIAELSKDIFADLGGPLTEVGVAIGVETAAGLAGGVPGLVAGAPAAGAAGAVARQEIAETFGAEEETAEERRGTALEGAIFSTVGAGLSASAGGLLKKGLRSTRATMLETPGSVIRQQAELRKGLKDFSEGLGRVQESQRVAGELVSDAVNGERERLGKIIGGIKDKVQQKIKSQGDPILKADNYSSELRGFLEDRGFDFAASLEGGAERAVLPSRETFLELGESRKILERLALDFNKIQKNGGLKFNEMERSLTDLSDIASFGEEATPASLAGKARGLRRKLSEDRFENYSRILEGTPEGRIVRESFQEYSSKVDAVKEWNRLIFLNQKISPEEYIDKLVRPKKSEEIINLKHILGENSQAFKDLKSNWLNARLRESIDPETGFFMQKKFEKSFEKYGEDVTLRLFSKAEKKELDRFVSLAKDLPQIDLTAPGARDRLKAGMITLSQQGFVHTRVNQILILMSKRPAELDYLSREGLLELAEKSRRPEEKRFFIRLADGIRKGLDSIEDAKRAALGRRVPVIGIAGGVSLRHAAMKDFNAWNNLSDRQIQDLLEDVDRGD